MAKDQLRTPPRAADTQGQDVNTDTEVGEVPPIDTRLLHDNVVAFPNRPIPEVVTDRPWRSRAVEPIDPPLAFVVFLLGGLLLAAARALDPVSDRLDGATPLWLLGVDTIVWAGVCLGGVGLVKFKAFGLWASAVAVVAIAVESLLCVMTGHHAFGLWWFGQIACISATGAVVATAFRINSRQPPSQA